MLEDPRAAFCGRISELDPSNPFTLLDIGCSGGLILQSRYVGSRLHAVGFDPNRAEIDRLRSIEPNPNVTYECGFVGVPAARAVAGSPTQAVFNRNPWPRLSAARTLEFREALRRRDSVQDRTEQNLWHTLELANRAETIFLPDYVSRHGMSTVDLIKIDVDGDDFAILCSIAPFLECWGVLALQVEVNFFGAGTPDEHSLHNVDRLLKCAGFELIALSTRRYSSAALPSTYVTAYPGPTKVGRIVQGDALFVRDLIALPPDSPRPARSRVLNLAVILALWDLPDMGAELIDRWPDDFGPEASRVAAKQMLLEILCALEGRSKVPEYSTLLEQFERDDPDMYSQSGRLAHFARKIPRADTLRRHLPVGLVSWFKRKMG